MPRRKRSSSAYDLFDDDDFDDDACSQNSQSGNPPQRNAANARERARMRILSSAFGLLKTKLPNIPPDTKLSKLDTLRLATMYIKQLKTLVENGSTCGVGATADGVANNENMLAGLDLEESGIFNFQHAAAASMSWPFGFHSSQGGNVGSQASRQLQFQYSTMDWSHNQPDAKYSRRSSDSTASSSPAAATTATSSSYPHANASGLQPHNPPNAPWYMETPTGSTGLDVHTSHCAYTNAAGSSLQMEQRLQQHYQASQHQQL